MNNNSSALELYRERIRQVRCGQARNRNISVIIDCASSQGFILPPIHRTSLLSERQSINNNSNSRSRTLPPAQ